MNRPATLLFFGAPAVALLLLGSCSDADLVTPPPDAGTSTGGTGGTGGLDLPNDEICTNAFDDDADGDIDCADSDCKTYSCTAPPPADWTGPFTFVPPVMSGAGSGGSGGGPTTAPQACEPGWKDVGPGILGPIAGAPATCAPCTCGAIAVGCSLPDVKSHGDTACATPANATVTPLASGTCTPFTSNDVQALTAAAPTLTALSCPASGGNATIEPATNGGEAVLCEASSGGGCKDDGVCAPEPGSGNPLCVARAGVHECPGAPYSVKNELFGGVSDSRNCTNCTCNPTPVTCSGSTTVFPAATDCTGTSVPVPNDGTCTAYAQGPTTGSFLYTATPAAGSCTTGGGMPTGTVLGGAPVTVCCAP